MNKLRNIVFINFIFLFYTISNLYAQDNLITTNPDFIDDIDGWSISGDISFAHDSNGYLTAGSAKNTVHSVDGNIKHRRMLSSTQSIPDSVKGDLIFLTFYAKGSADSLRTRVRVWVYDDAGGSPVQKTSTLKLDTLYGKYTLALRTWENSTSFKLSMDIGLDTGIYWFDDFSMVYSPVDISSIQQFEENKVPRFFIYPDSVVTTSLDTDTSHATVVLTIDPDKIIAPVLKTQFGVNSNMRSGDGLVDRAHLYEQMGAFRFPAGSGSNQYFWDGNIPDTFLIPVNAYSGTYWKFLKPHKYLDFKAYAGGEGSIVANYFYARYGVTDEGTREARVLQAADYAALWVEYFNNTKNDSVKYWEIGNECYGGWETGYNVNGSIVTGKEYGEDLRVFSTAMKNIDTTVRIGAVVAINNYSGWTEQVLREVEDSADYLILHNYYSVTGGASAINAVENIGWEMRKLQANVEHNTSKPAGYFPIDFTEFNIQGDPTTSMVNGLFTADALGTIIEYRYDLATMWVNEWNINGNETHGLLAKNDPNQADFTARPVYTPQYYYGKMFGDRMIADTIACDSIVRSYSSVFSSGDIGVVIINYSDTTQKLMLEFSDSTIVDSVFWYSVYADNIDNGNKKFYVNGLTSNTTGGGPADLDTVFAYAAVFSDTSLLTLHKYSVTYLVLKKKHTGTPTGIWTGTYSEDWTTVFNWEDHRIPDENTDVVISSVPAGGRFPKKILNGKAVCKSITLEPGATLKIPENKVEYAEALRLLKLLSYFVPIKEENEIPPTSIMREFLDGSSFKY